jgi:hypothetical protein
LLLRYKCTLLTATTSSGTRNNPLGSFFEAGNSYIGLTSLPFLFIPTVDPDSTAPSTLPCRHIPPSVSDDKTHREIDVVLFSRD